MKFGYHRLLVPLLCGASLVSCMPEEEAGGSASAGDGPRLRVLGSAQDGGIPHAACRCERCEDARSDPSAARLVASLALILPEESATYLIDATPDIRRQLERLSDVSAPPAGRVDRDPVDGVFLTHAHLGHYTGLAFFGFEAIHTERLPVYVTPAMARFLARNAPWSQLVEIENIVLEEVVPGDGKKVAQGVSVDFVKVPHRDEYADTVGFLFRGPKRRILYIPDTEPWEKWDTPPMELFREVDVLLVDGTFFSLDELPGRSVDSIGHPLMTTTMDLLQGLVDQGRPTVYFTHFNHSNPVLEKASQERKMVISRGFHILQEGQDLEF